MIYAILGQTASGKTGLACKLAKELNLPLIGADAFQVYSELEIGSAKPTKEELEGVEHYLIDDTSIQEEMNVKVYQEKARKLIEKFILEGRDVIVSGGTFLYVKSLFYPYEFNQEEKVEDELDSLDEEELFSILQKEDYATSQIIDPHNLRRVIRAIRMARSGNKKSTLVKDSPSLLYPVKFFAIDIDKDEGNAKIETRVHEMVKEGLFQEVDELLSKYDPSLIAFQAIGYKEVIVGKKENQTDEEITERIIIDTRQYAKRQRTFLRHQFDNIHFMKKDDIYSYIKNDSLRRKRNQASLPGTCLANIEKKKVLVIGIGGVGSILAQGLVRLGVNNLTLVDKDIVDITNLNRQVLYTFSDVGKDKVEAAKTHLLELDSLLNIEIKKETFHQGLINEDYDFVFDCIDDVSAKADLIEKCLDLKIPFICASGSGLRYQGDAYCLGTLALSGEPLVKAVKKELQRRNWKYSFEQVPIAYSKEVPLKRTKDYISSNVVSPNVEGLCMLSFFIKSCF